MKFPFVLLFSILLFNIYSQRIFNDTSNIINLEKSLFSPDRPALSGFVEEDSEGNLVSKTIAMKLPSEKGVKLALITDIMDGPIQVRFFEYDEKGLLVRYYWREIYRKEGISLLLFREKYSYLDKKLVKINYENGFVIYNYSPLVGDLRTETYKDDKLVSYSVMDIDSSGRMIERQGYSEDKIESRETWSYEKNGLEATWKWYWENSKNCFSEEKYFYDEKGILLKIETYKNSKACSTITFFYRDNAPEN